MDIKGVLLRIADENDEAAFKTFFKLYHPKLLAFARLFVKHPHLAEDVVSDALVQLLKQRQRIFRMENFESYLFLTVKNHALNLLKKKANQLQPGTNETHERAEHDHPLQQLLDSELRERITTATEALPPRRKMVYQLVKDERMSYREVAQLMSISERTVENHLDAAVKDLRRAIQAYLSEQETYPKNTYQKDLIFPLTLLTATLSALNFFQ